MGSLLRKGNIALKAGEPCRGLIPNSTQVSRARVGVLDTLSSNPVSGGADRPRATVTWCFCAPPGRGQTTGTQ